MKAATDKVAQASQTLGAAMYATAQQAGGDATADEAADMSEDDVVDAEIVDDDANEAK
jgi:molecular chaperone DnaK